MNYKRFRHLERIRSSWIFSFLAIAFNIKKMCAKMIKEGMNWLMKLFYKLTTAIFRLLGTNKSKKYPKYRNLKK